MQRGRDDVKVVVRYPAEDRRSLADLEKMRIRAADGSAVPFSSVASAKLGGGFSSIQREDRRRVVSVTAEVDSRSPTPTRSSPSSSGRTCRASRPSTPASRSPSAASSESSAEVLGSLIRGWIMALMVIYALLAVPLRSYSQPLIIMARFPSAWSGPSGVT